MSHHASSHPRRVHHKPKDKGTAVAHRTHELRIKTAEATSGVIGAGATLTGATVQTASDPVNYYPGIVYDNTGLKAYNAGGVITLQIFASDGSLTVNGTGTITGGTIQTSASNPRVVMDASGIRAYSPSGGTPTFNLNGADGSLTVGGAATITGGTIQTSPPGSSRVVLDANGLRAYDSVGNNTVNIDTTGTLTVAKGSITLSSAVPAGTGARISIDATGIKAYNASNVNTFVLDGATGLIQATGVITAQSGSNIPTAVISGYLPGSANRYSNSAFQNGAGVSDTTGWTISNGTTSDGGTTVPPVYGARTLKVVSTSTNNVYVFPTSFTDAYRRVLPGLNYTFSHYVYPATTARVAGIDIYWYDSAGVQLSVDYDAVGTATVLNQWTRIARTSPAPAGAAYGLGVHYMGTNGAANETYYTECFQMEQGDRVSAWAPRPDEILVNQINAVNINVANLAAINANLGNITSGTVTGATVQTATSGTRVVMDGTGLTAYSGSTPVLQFSTSTGALTLTGSIQSGSTITGATVQTAASGDRVWMDSTGLNVAAITSSVGSGWLQGPNVDKISFRRQSDNVQLGAIGSLWYTGTPSTNNNLFVAGVTTATGIATYANLEVLDGQSTGNPPLAYIQVQGTSGTGGSILVNAVNSVGTGGATFTLVNGSGYSDFVVGASTGFRRINFGYGSFAGNGTATVTITSFAHGLNGYSPNCFLMTAWGWLGACSMTNVTRDASTMNSLTFQNNFGSFTSGATYYFAFLAGN